ncbi:hypothetical protein ONE63_002172 [Megalurothrips usitatus]|uniref:Uncharacterized protein n=1 Tax=Megalurothrips usitatus TaxID=439358 RepID=A0AAV7XGY9_9NEOP|nr:hypothetical protein ONE63_002172 [Megalurothrips usitatus]KAJ1523043.1 hypothetical protein ONE63_002172 [Megalurothrips usitatus]
MAPSKSQKKVGSNGASSGKSTGLITGAILPAAKKVDPFPLMSYVAKNCKFEDDGEDSCLEEEEALKASNDQRLDDLLKQAAADAQTVEETSSDEARRKKALEVLYSMEHTRNQEETWKISQPQPKKQFLHPLKKSDKDEEYFSGTRKVKPVKERKRCRSDEVVMLDDGKLVPKDGASQLPIEITMPLRSSSYRPRVPSVGLPFTPAASPPPTLDNRWMQRSGSELFSDVQSNTLRAYNVTTDEEKAIALAIAESIRSAKEEQERILNFKDAYNCPSTSLSTARFDDKPYARPPADPLGTVWLDDGSSIVEATETKEMPKKNREKSIERNNNSWENTCMSTVDVGKQSKLDQRPKYSTGTTEKPHGNGTSGDLINNSSLNQRLLNSDNNSETRHSKLPSTLGFRKALDSVSQELDQDHASECISISLQTKQDADPEQRGSLPYQNSQVTHDGVRSNGYTATVAGPKLADQRLVSELLPFTESCASASSVMLTSRGMQPLEQPQKKKYAISEPQNGFESTSSTVPGCPIDSRAESKCSSTDLYAKVPMDNAGKYPETSSSGADSRPSKLPASSTSFNQKDCLSGSSFWDKPNPVELSADCSSRSLAGEKPKPQLPTSVPATALVQNSSSSESSARDKPEPQLLTSTPATALVQNVSSSESSARDKPQPSLAPVSSLIQNGSTSEFSVRDKPMPSRVLSSMPALVAAMKSFASENVPSSVVLNDKKYDSQQRSSMKISDKSLYQGESEEEPKKVPRPTTSNHIAHQLPKELPNPQPNVENIQTQICQMLLMQQLMQGMQPGNLPGMPNMCGFPGGMVGLPNNLHGMMPGLPNNLPGLPCNLPGLPENFPGLPASLPGCLPGLPNNLPGMMPGLPNNFSGMMPGPPNFLQGTPGVSNPSLGMQNNSNGLPNSFSGGLPDFMMPGMPNLKQFGAPLPIPGIVNCNSFGGLAGSMYQPGPTPLIPPGKGRGRLSKP